MMVKTMMNRMLNVSINYLGICETGPRQARSMVLFRNFYYRQLWTIQWWRKYIEDSLCQMATTGNYSVLLPQEARNKWVVLKETVALGPHNMSILQQVWYMWSKGPPVKTQRSTFISEGRVSTPAFIISVLSPLHKSDKDYILHEHNHNYKHEQ